MNPATFAWPAENASAPRLRQAASLALGFAFTAGLLGGVAFFDRARAPAPAIQLDDLQSVAIADEAPPPPPQPQPEPQPDTSDLTGIDLGRSDSPVTIAIRPPDPDSFAVPEVAPPAVIRAGLHYTDLRPKSGLETDFQRVFQISEVDRIPSIVERPDPRIPDSVRNRAKKLRVVALFIVDERGSVSKVWVLKSSGNAEFDRIIVRSMQEDWVFNPAMKNGRNVKCMMQEATTVEWTEESPFE